MNKKDESNVLRKRRLESNFENLYNDENDKNYVNLLYSNNPKNGLSYKFYKFHKSINHQNGLTDETQINNSNFRTAAKKVLYENQPQFVDLDHLKENQDKPGLRSLIKQCLNCNWFFGTFLLLFLYIEFLMKLFYNWWSPKSQIDICPSKILKDENRLTKIRNSAINETNISMLKVGKHQFTKSCRNCYLYLEQPELIEYYLNNICKFNLFKSIENSFNLIDSTNNFGLKTIELITHKLLDCKFDIKQLPKKIVNHKDSKLDQQIKDEFMVQCQQLEQERLIDNEQDNEQDNYRTTESLKVKINNSQDLNLEELNREVSRQTIEQFDDDDYEQQDKNSTTESTSGYNTSNSLDSDNLDNSSDNSSDINFDNNSDNISDNFSESNSTNSDYSGECDLSSKYRLNDCYQTIINDRLKNPLFNRLNINHPGKQTKKKRILTINSTKLTSLLNLSKQKGKNRFVETKDTFSGIIKLNFDQNFNEKNNQKNESNKYRCDSQMSLQSILVKN